MARLGEGTDPLKCSFCGKGQKQVKKLIAGPGVYICDECIELCNEIIDEELQETTDLPFEELPKPKEIYAFLNNYFFCLLNYILFLYFWFLNYLGRLLLLSINLRLFLFRACLLNG